MEKVVSFLDIIPFFREKHNLRLANAYLDNAVSMLSCFSSDYVNKDKIDGLKDAYVFSTDIVKKKGNNNVGGFFNEKIFIRLDYKFDILKTIIVHEGLHFLSNSKGYRKEVADGVFEIKSFDNSGITSNALSSDGKNVIRENGAFDEYITEYFTQLILKDEYVKGVSAYEKGVSLLSKLVSNNIINFNELMYSYFKNDGDYLFDALKDRIGSNNFVGLNTYFNQLNNCYDLSAFIDASNFVNGLVRGYKK